MASLAELINLFRGLNDCQYQPQSKITNKWLNSFQDSVNDRAVHTDERNSFVVDGIECVVTNIYRFNWNGYVKLPSDHPDFFMNQRQMNSIYSAYNGIEYCQDGIIGFTTATENDYCLMREIMTGKSESHLEYKSYNFVKCHTINLAKQVAERYVKRREQKRPGGEELFTIFMDIMGTSSKPSKKSQCHTIPRTPYSTPRCSGCPYFTDSSFDKPMTCNQPQQASNNFTNCAQTDCGQKNCCQKSAYCFGLDNCCSQKCTSMPECQTKQTCNYPQTFTFQNAQTMPTENCQKNRQQNSRQQMDQQTCQPTKCQQPVSWNNNKIFEQMANTFGNINFTDAKSSETKPVCQQSSCPQPVSWNNDNILEQMANAFENINFTDVKLSETKPVQKNEPKICEDKKEQSVKNKKDKSVKNNDFFMKLMDNIFNMMEKQLTPKETTDKKDEVPDLVPNNADVNSPPETLVNTNKNSELDVAYFDSFDYESSLSEDEYNQTSLSEKTRSESVNSDNDSLSSNTSEQWASEMKLNAQPELEQCMGKPSNKCDVKIETEME